MSKRRTIFTFSLVLALSLTMALFSGGCAERKPLPDNVPPGANPPQLGPDNVPQGEIRTPTPDAPPPGTPDPAIDRQAKDLADDVAARVSDIDGIERAYVLVLGNVALIGIDVDANVRGTQVERLREEAAARAVDQRDIVNAVVQADVETVQRIREMAEGVRQGRPISEFFTQINEILNRAKPTTE